MWSGAYEDTTMALQLRGSRVKVSKLTGALVAVFALFIQPLVALNVPSAFAAPVINEVMPNPVSITDANGEWVELKNDDDVAVDISGWTIDGATISANKSIPANGLFVICSNAKATTVCDDVKPGITLTNTGETLQLKNTSAELVDEFTYTSSSAGKSVEVVRENGTVTGVKNTTDSYPTNQATPNSNNKGTPGAQNRAKSASVTVGTVGDYASFQAGLDAVADGGTVTLVSNITANLEVGVTKAVTINGAGFTLSTTIIYDSGDKNNSVIEINNATGVVIENLIGDGAGGTNLNGINTFKATATLNNVTTNNNDKFGLVVNGSNITVSSITTSNNTWGGIDVDISSTTNPAALTVNGTSTHSEAGADIYVDDTTKNVSVTDTNGQYSSRPSGLPGRANDRVYTLRTAPPAKSTETVSGDTASGENDTGKWLFNRDSSTSSPYEFNTDQATIGTGSLNVKPIGANPSDKFIGELFVQQKVSDVYDISYDYRLDARVPTGKANEFYANVYVNFDDSNRYGDCVYNVVPSNGSTGWHTAVFDTQSSYSVRNRTATPCPARPADLPANAEIRAFVINVGDTSSNDQDVAGYFDNVVVRGANTHVAYDFEPADTAAPAFTITTPSNGSISKDTTPTFSGTGEPSATVTVKVGGQTLSTVVDNSGNWSVTASKLADGKYTATITSTDTAMNESDPKTVAFTIAQPESSNPGSGSGDGNPSSPANGSGTTTSQSSNSTPGTISPLSQLAFNQGIAGASNTGAASVFGSTPSTTDSSETDDDTSGDVLGTESPSTDSSVKSAAVAQSPEGWKLFGIAWYWILLLLGALAALWWFLVARRRNAEEDANL